MSSITWRAVCGSNRSFISDQKPGDDGGPEGRHVQVDRDRGQAWLHEAQPPLREQQDRASRRG